MNTRNDAEEYYYVIDGDRKGPTSLDVLKEKYELGELSERTLVWTKTFGDDWKKLEDLHSIRPPNEPPLVPEEAIPNRWLYLLISVPLLMGFVEVVLLESVPVLYNSSNGLILALYWLPNTICALLDMQCVQSSGRKDATKGLLIWLILIVPVYIFLRSRRTGKGVWPVVSWIAAFVLGIFVTEALPTSVYMGAGMPRCDSRVSISMVEEIYPDIPFVDGAQVIDVREIAEVSSDSSDGLRECRATIADTRGEVIPVVLTITEIGEEFYFELEVNEF